MIDFPFWTQRLKSHGHTGWGDHMVYVYDQIERLSIVRNMILTMYPGPTDNKLALDFGCGTGDFSRMLLSLGFAVCAYDPVVKPQIQNKKFVYFDNLNSPSFHAGVFDIALSITVLDHILDETELDNTLSLIQARVPKYFLLIEYALNSESERTAEMKSNVYQSFRTLDSWRKSLEKHSFAMSGVYGIPHPMSMPSIGYQKFQQNYGVRIIRKLLQKGINARVMSPLLRLYASHLVKQEPYKPEAFQESPLKMMICRHS